MRQCVSPGKAKSTNLGARKPATKHAHPPNPNKYRPYCMEQGHGIIVSKSVILLSLRFLARVRNLNLMKAAPQYVKFSLCLLFSTEWWELPRTRPTTGKMIDARIDSRQGERKTDRNQNGFSMQRKIRRPQFSVRFSYVVYEAGFMEKILFLGRCLDLSVRRNDIFILFTFFPARFPLSHVLRNILSSWAISRFGWQGFGYGNNRPEYSNRMRENFFLFFHFLSGVFITGEENWCELRPAYIIRLKGFEILRS